LGKNEERDIDEAGKLSITACLDLCAGFSCSGINFSNSAIIVGIRFIYYLGCVIKKITAILFLSLHLFHSTALTEIFKINILVQHFHEHQKNDENIGFTRFLIMHYLTDDLNDKDNDRDMQLPFKSAGITRVFNSIQGYLSGQYSSPVVQSFVLDERDLYLSVKDMFIITDYQSLVWHPPNFS
jgi:hypothetical protein